MKHKGLVCSAFPNKKRYATQKKANLVLLAQLKETALSLRTYFCSSCKGYHLTKQELKADVLPE